MLTPENSCTGDLFASDCEEPSVSSPLPKRKSGPAEVARANAITASISVINNLRTLLANRNVQLPSTSAAAAAVSECHSETDEEEEEDRSAISDETRSVALCGQVSASSRDEEPSDDSVDYIVLDSDEQPSESNDDASQENQQSPVNAPIIKSETPERCSQHAQDPFDDTEWLKGIELTHDFEGLLDFAAAE
jgi:hypothetical protein